ncbi:MAG: hypothetical protein CMB96_04580, partial [Flavobacteriaceae bacterium]|nr:hypothetical protein [Flavobacteriaceae bacterium]
AKKLKSILVCESMVSEKKIASIKFTNMSSIMKINGTSLSALSEALRAYMPEVVSKLATEYNFDQEAGLKVLGELSVQKEGKSRGVKAKRVVPKILLPFCGVVQEDWCKAVRYNRGLFTQCTNACKGEKFCKTCVKSVNEAGVPTYGLIEERGNEGWTCPKGKTPVNYGNIMAKIDVTKEQAIAEAEKLGWTIPEEQFEVVKTRKGRPAKKAKEADEKPKKRGRPKKTKPVVEAAGTGDDLIAQLVQQAQQQNEVVAAQETEDEESVDGSEPTQSPTDEESTEDEVEKQPKKKVVRKKKTAEEKEAEKQAKAEAKAKLAAEKKAAKEAEKEAAKLAKAEAKAKLAAEKKAAKEAEKLAKAEAKKAEKLAKAEAKKADKKADVAEKESPKTLTPTEEVVEEMGELQIESPTALDEEEEDDAVEVVKFTHEGVEYLRDGDGTVYDMETQEEIGEWDEESKVLTLN